MKVPLWVRREAHEDGRVVWNECIRAAIDRPGVGAHETKAESNRSAERRIVTNGQKAYEAWAASARKHQPKVPDWFELPQWQRESYEAGAAAVAELSPALSQVRAALVEAEKELNETMPPGASQKRWLTARRLVREAREVTDPKPGYVLRVTTDEVDELAVLQGKPELLKRAAELIERYRGLTYEFVAPNHCVIKLTPEMRELVEAAKE